MKDEDIESDDESTSSQIRQDFSQILDEFLDKYEISGRKIVQKLEGDNVQDQLETIRQGLRKININHDKPSPQNEGKNGLYNDNGENKSSKVYNESQDVFVHVESEEKDKRQTWDCQSILSKRKYPVFQTFPSLLI